MAHVFDQKRPWSNIIIFVRLRSTKNRTVIIIIIIFNYHYLVKCNKCDLKNRKVFKIKNANLRKLIINKI